VKPELESAFRQALASLLEPPPKEKPSDWCCAGNLYIPSPVWARGPFGLAGREYCREFIDDFGNPYLRDVAACFGSQSGKTQSIMAGLAWAIVRMAVAALWVMPNRDLVKSFSKNRWMPFLSESRAFQGLIPKGAKRHDFSAYEQNIRGSQVNFVGTHSPANLSSRPVNLVILDEVDKFNEGTDREADAVDLAEQRTKDAPLALRVKASTPTLSDAPIWQEFIKGDQRRYFVPCPHCAKPMLLAWRPQFTIFKLTGKESFVHWDKEAKRPDGSWDYDRVMRSARFQCWSCEGHIQDGHKTRMIRDGKWEATNPHAPASFRSRHLSSLYAASPETGVGYLAKKFLEKKKSLMGLQGFINGDLAEPYESQDISSARVEIISPDAAKPLAKKTLKQLTADCQEIEPHWWLIREWSPTGDSRLVDYGTWLSWEELRAIQLKHGVEDQDVGIDSAHRGTSVIAQCAVFGQMIRVEGEKPGTTKLEWFGWTPMRGLPAGKFWLDPEGNKLPWGTSPAPTQENMQLLEFNGPTLKDILWRLRNKKTIEKWELSTVAKDVYFRHLDSEIKRPTFVKSIGRTIQEWVPRSHNWPNHLLDCELEQLAKAMQSGILRVNPEPMTAHSLERLTTK
jgi:hypothetical protein